MILEEKRKMEKTKRRKTVSESELQEISGSHQTLINERSSEISTSESETDISELTRHDEAIAAAINFSEFEIEKETETDIIPASTSKNVERNNSIQEKPTFSKLKSNIPKHITRKGKSRVNSGKGKGLSKNICPVDGDLLEISRTFSAQKRIFELTEESYQQDVVERIRNTIKDRVTSLAEINAYTLSQVHKTFVENSIPLSMRLPIRLPIASLSSLLVVEEKSGFLQSFKGSINLQDILRRALLEEKHLPVCRCGYIYVHPSLTFAKSPGDENMLVGQFGGMLVFEKKEVILEKLDKFRYFLELLYEYFTM